MNQLAAIVAKLPTNTQPLQQTGGTVTANQGTAGSAPLAHDPLPGRRGAVGFQPGFSPRSPFRPAPQPPPTKQPRSPLKARQPTPPTRGPVRPRSLPRSRGIYAATLAPIASGTNIIGKVGIDQTTPGTTNKVTLGTDNVAVTEAAGANVTLGTTADTASAPNGSAGTIDALIKGLLSSPAACTGAAAFNDTVGSPLAASGTFTGAYHSTGVTDGTGTTNTNTPYAYVNVNEYSDQAGTIFVEQSVDATTYYPPEQSRRHRDRPQGASYSAKFPLTMPVYRVRFTNGATAQTKFQITSNFSGS